MTSFSEHQEKLPDLIGVQEEFATPFNKGFWVPEGKIEENEIATYPKGHVYTVQKKAWMDARVWHFYLRSVLAHFGSLSSTCR
ncbi:hypothetical protein PC116_g21449 [Phytophthora cactorum]|nr:hypothetical protein PC116_g21449 [Phytophthora cactorum]